MACMHTMDDQIPEVSSLVAAAVVDVSVPYDDQNTPAPMAPGGMASTSAFRRYEQHLRHQRRLTKPACRQRMLKTAMRYSHQLQQASGNQQQHIISECKRREKLNGSFRALKAVLPPASKRKKLGQTSILSITREYVLSLKSKVRELEEKNKALGSQLAEEDEKVEIQITRAEDQRSGEVCTVKVAATPPHSNTTDVAIRILQHLKDLMGQDVSLVSMSTGDEPQRASLTLQLKPASGAMWVEEAVREAVTKAMTRPAPGGLCGAE